MSDILDIDCVELSHWSWWLVNPLGQNVRDVFANQSVFAGNHPLCSRCGQSFLYFVCFVFCMNGLMNSYVIGSVDSGILINV